MFTVHAFILSDANNFYEIKLKVNLSQRVFNNRVHLLTSLSMRYVAGYEVRLLYIIFTEYARVQMPLHGMTVHASPQIMTRVSGTVTVPPL
jgi:hypothetical protein